MKSKDTAEPFSKSILFSEQGFCFLAKCSYFRLRKILPQSLYSPVTYSQRHFI